MNKAFLYVIQNKEGPWALILTERLIITTKSLINISDGLIPKFINNDSDRYRFQFQNQCISVPTGASFGDTVDRYRCQLNSLGRKSDLLQ